MDGGRFDAWTRRRFGLVAGGLVASLLGMPRLEPAAAGKCRDLRQPCGKRKPCCKGKNLKCGTTLDLPEGQHCCRPVQGRCEIGNQCCGALTCSSIAGKTGTRCCGAEGHACDVQDDCCHGTDCVYTKEAGYVCLAFP